MICPECKTAFSEGTERCGTCGAPLIDSLPESLPKMELCALIKTTDIAHLSVLKSVLDAAGIEHSVQGEEGLHQIPITWSGGFFDSSAHGATVWVRSEDLEEARRLIQPEPEAVDEVAEGMSAATGERSPFDDAELYDVLFSGLRYDVDFYLGLARESSGPVLEVACGTGRVLIPLLGAGIDADGLDLYPAMLEVLRKRARSVGFEPRLYQGDMRAFSLPRRYRLIIIPFNGFLHNLSAEDQLDTLRACRTHLLPGGLLAMEIFFPGLQVIAGAEGTPVLEHEVRHPQTGNQVRIYDTRRFDRVEQTQQSDIEIQELDAEGRLIASHRSHTAIRWIYKSELELLLSAAGFARREICGGFDRRPLTSETQTMIVFAWRD